MHGILRPGALLAAALAVLFVLACRDGGSRDAAESPRQPEYPAIVRRGIVIEPTDSVFEEEWAKFYPAVARDQSELWTFEGRLEYKSSFDRSSLGIRAEPLGVVAGHFAPPTIFVRPTSDGLIRIRALPPMRTLRLTLTGAPATLGGDFLDITPPTGGPVTLKVYPRSGLKFRLRRADGAPLGRWVAGLRRPYDTAHSLRGPNSHPNEGRGLHRFSRNDSEEVEFEGLHPGEYELTALCVGFSKQASRVTLLPGETRDLGDLVLPRGINVRVQLDPTAGLVLPEGLRVTATPLQTRPGFTPNWPSRRLLLEHEVTEWTSTAPVDAATGEANLRGLFKGLYALRIVPSSTNAIQTPPHVLSIESDTSTTIKVGPLATIRAVVTDEEGRPLDTGVVTTQLPLSADFALQLSSTDAEGRFTFAVPAGLHQITARSRGATYPRSELLLNAEAGQEFDLTMVLQPTAVFEGTIDVAGQRRHEPLLSLHPRIGQWDKIGVPVDSDGSFKEVVPTGEYDLFDGTDFLKRVDLTDGNIRSRFAIDTQTAELSVEVLDDRGRRIRHAWAAMLSSEQALQQQLRVPPRFAARGQDGKLDLPGLPLGKYTLIVDAAGFRQSSKPITIVSAGELRESITLTPGGGCFEVNVRRESDGDAIEESMLQQMTVDGRVLMLGGGRTDIDGNDEIREVPDGVIEFDVAPPVEVPPLAMARVRLERIAPDEYRTVPVTLAAGTNVRIVLYEGGLSPVNDAALEVEGLREDEVGARFAAYIRHFAPLSGYDGAFPVFAMPRGRPLVLRVKRPGFPVLEKVITPEGDDVMLVELRYPERSQ